MHGMPVLIHCDSSPVSEEDGEDDNCFITFTTSESRCDALFEEGLDMVARGDPNSALCTFLETLTALQDCQYTNRLLPTLHQVASAYGVLGEVGKSREILDTLSVMQEALDEEMREKWRERKGKRKGKVGGSLMLEQADCGNLFLKKAESCLKLASEHELNGDHSSALEMAFRLQQYTLGPGHPTTVKSLRNLIAIYTSCPEGSIHSTLCFPGPIIFTSDIKSSSMCSQTSTTPPPLHVHPASCSPSATQHPPPLLAWGSDTFSSSHEALHLFSVDSLQGCGAKKGKELTPIIYSTTTTTATTDSPMPTTAASPTTGTEDSPNCPPLREASTTTTQEDLHSHLIPAASGQLECNGDSHHPYTFTTFPPFRESASLTSFLALLLFFGLTAVAAISLY